MSDVASMRPAVWLIALGIALSACGATEPAESNSAATTTEVGAGASLVGVWERAGSSFTSLDGMIVEVEPDASFALITAVPDNEFQFRVGDEKWRMIEPVAAAEWSFEDLVRESGSGAESYVPGFISMGPDGDRLEMTFPTTGTSQTWVRVGSGG